LALGFEKSSGATTVTLPIGISASCCPPPISAALAASAAAWTGELLSCGRLEQLGQVELVLVERIAVDAVAYDGCHRRRWA